MATKKVDVKDAGDPKDLPYRMTVDRVDGDPDFTIAVKSPEAAMDIIKGMISDGFLVNPVTNDVTGDLKIEVVPLHRIRVFEIFKKKD